MQIICSLKLNWSFDAILVRRIYRWIIENAFQRVSQILHKSRKYETVRFEILFEFKKYSTLEKTQNHLSFGQPFLLLNFNHGNKHIKMLNCCSKEWNHFSCCLYGNFHSKNFFCILHNCWQQSVVLLLNLLRQLNSSLEKRFTQIWIRFNFILLNIHTCVVSTPHMNVMLSECLKELQPI